MMEVIGELSTGTILPYLENALDSTALLPRTNRMPQTLYTSSVGHGHVHYSEISFGFNARANNSEGEGLSPIPGSYAQALRS